MSTFFLKKKGEEFTSGRISQKITRVFPAIGMIQKSPTWSMIAAAAAALIGERRPNGILIEPTSIDERHPPLVRLTARAPLLILASSG